jgi:hypothetical protein
MTHSGDLPDDIIFDDLSDGVSPADGEAALLKQELELRIEQIAILQRDLRDTQSELSTSESETYQLQRCMDDYIRENLELKDALQSKSHALLGRSGSGDVARVDFDSDSDLEAGAHGRPNGKMPNGVHQNGAESSHLQVEVSLYFFNFIIFNF